MLLQHKTNRESIGLLKAAFITVLNFNAGLMVKQHFLQLILVKEIQLVTESHVADFFQAQLKWVKRDLTRDTTQSED